MAVYKRKQGIMAADMNGEKVMMDITTGKYYNLGQVGGRMWEILEKPRSRAELISALTAEYNVTPEQCDTDIEPFMRKMLEIGLIVEEN